MLYLVAFKLFGTEFEELKRHDAGETDPAGELKRQTQPELPNLAEEGRKRGAVAVFQVKAQRGDSLVSRGRGRRYD